nr:MAG TPA: hypothetical protein [Caudoviricetes sp.]
MINADKAREIQKQAQAERDTHIRNVIRREAENAYEAIVSAAKNGRNNCCIDVGGMNYPNGVAEYLKNKFGYDALYSSHAISIAW